MALVLLGFHKLSIRHTAKGGTVGNSGYSGWKKPFRFVGLLPGEYVIEAQGEVETKDPTREFTKTASLIGSAEVIVADRDVMNVVLPLHPGIELRGHVKMEGADSAKPFGNGDLSAFNGARAAVL